MVSVYSSIVFQIIASTCCKIFGFPGGCQLLSHKRLAKTFETADCNRVAETLCGVMCLCVQFSVKKALSLAASSSVCKTSSGTNYVSSKTGKRPDSQLSKQTEGRFLLEAGLGALGHESCNERFGHGFVLLTRVRGEGTCSCFQDDGVCGR